jgi:hypothetical protein
MYRFLITPMIKPWILIMILFLFVVVGVGVGIFMIQAASSIRHPALLYSVHGHIHVHAPTPACDMQHA